MLDCGLVNATTLPRECQYNLPTTDSILNISGIKFDSPKAVIDANRSRIAIEENDEAFGFVKKDKFLKKLNRRKKQNRNKNNRRKRMKNGKGRKRQKIKRNFKSQGYLLGRLWILSAPWMTYLMVSLSVEILLVNIFVISIFLQRKNRTPVTILLSVLAFSDSFAAVSTAGLDLYVLRKYTNDEKHSDHHYDGFKVKLLYEDCIGLNFSLSISRAFHLVSVLVTTALCLQKVWVIMFPFANKFNSKKSVILSILIGIATFFLYLPKFIFRFELYGRKRNGRCYDRNLREGMKTISKVNTYFHWIILGIYVICVVATVSGSVYITCKLTCLRRNLPWIDTTVTQQRHRRSAVMVVLICIIFVLSEIMNMVLIFNDFSHKFVLSKDARHIFRTCRGISLQVGFALNFFVYLAIGEQLRSVLKTIMNKICCCRR